ncbi:MAG: serine/threonine protein kinase, partial [Planctomycetes bacterium]|nr:serine/threonine protein kinase [Planctomycetota bacterium]
MSPAASADPSLPSTIGAYRILGHLGKGGMAQVYRAEHRTLKRAVALKVVLPDFAEDPAFRERFLAEAQASASLSHANVITCYDAGEDDGHLFMALELVEGGDLMAMMERRGGRLDEGEVLAFAHDCLAGIGAIAAAGLVHRDIKPANIFVTATGQAKIADLGLARQVRVAASATAGKEASIMGTPCYMSPEQIHCLPDLDVRTDLYALGASLVHLLTGAPLHAGADPLATLAMTLSAPFPDLRSRRSDLSSGVCAILQRLLARDRDQRYRSAEEAREDVGRALSDV